MSICAWFICLIREIHPFGAKVKNHSSSFFCRKFFELLCCFKGTETNGFEAFQFVNPTIRIEADLINGFGYLC